ncbi:MAG TPA: TIGR03086 family metal-binding protein [Acidimicrobiales bacterium]|nr:TIGR03086 family metal-binding protein [Acidimicrobiales bacterium]
MSEISERYARRAAALADKVAAVSDDDWSNPSPCEDWTARDIVRHVVETQGMFLGFVGREMDDLPSVDEDPEGALRGATGRIQRDLEDPERAGETFEGMMGTQRFDEAVDRFLSADLVVHNWDLSKATGQDTTIPDEEVAAMWELAKGWPSEGMRGPGAFGPEVEVPEDASEQDKLLGFLGRQP